MEGKIVQLKDKDGHNIYPISVTDDKTDIDAKQVYTATFAGTTDNNSFIAVPTSVVTPTTGIIVGVRSATISCMPLVFSGINEGNHYTIRLLGWDLSNSNANRSVSITIAYTKD